MFELRTRKRQGRKVPSELLAADFSTTGTKLLKVKADSKAGLQVIGVELLPPTPLLDRAAPRDLLHGLEKPFRSNYVALTSSSPGAVVRLLSLPGQLEGAQAIEAHLREHAGLEGRYRLAYSAAKSTAAARGGKAEAKYLAVAMPEAEAQALLEMVNVGPPAPWSIEVSGLGAMTAFLHGPGRNHREDAVAVLEAGAASCLLALFNKGSLVLVRKFDFGSETLMAKVQESMGVDREVAEGIISDGSFDISNCVRDIMGPFLRQLSISREFVERQEKCRITHLYLSGGLSLSKCWVEEIARGSKLSIQLWNPFEFVRVAPGAFPERFQGQQARFAAALGAACGAYEEA